MTVNRWASIIESFTPLLGIMVAGSLTIFAAMVMYAQALGRGSMAVVNSLSAVSVVFALPITLIGNMIAPGAFGSVTGDLFIWVLRAFGLILVVIGVIALEAADVRSYVFISVESNTGDILPALFDIKGVQSAAAVAGKHDYILRIKSRSLVKTRSKVLKKIQQIQNIKEIETLVVIRDYR
jgi:DNA-binding Lrp family transcriptional regulator